MKQFVRKMSSARPASFTSSKVRKRKMNRGGVASKRDKRTKGDADFFFVKKHDNNQMRTVLAKMTVSEARKLSVSTHGVNRRQRQQLVTLGKIDRDRSVKTENNVPERWANLVPLTVPFTVEGLLRAMVTGLIKPLYDINGKRACE